MMKLLEDGFSACKILFDKELSRLEYLSEYIFNFTTYDSELSEELGRKAVDVCAAINNGTTFDYIEDKDNCRWFILMCNMPFFADRINWGTSIRGAWWDCCPLESCGLFDGTSQVCVLDFNQESWKLFISQVVEFARKETRIKDDGNGGPGTIGYFSMSG